MSKRILALVIAFCGSFAGLRAETIPIDANCKVALVSYLNGSVQIALTGSTALTLTQCEIQCRAHGAAEETAWSAVKTATLWPLGPGGTDQKHGKFCCVAFPLSADADVRFRGLAISGSTTNATDWVTQEDVRVASYPITPTAYTKNGTVYPVTSNLGLLKNTSLGEVIELDPASSQWVQFDLGRVKNVAGLRVLPRLAFAGRLQNAIVQVSDAEDMSNAQTVIAATPAPGTPIDATDWAFPAPVQCRYIRVTANGSGMWIDIAEAEPYSDRPDASLFSLSVQQSAYNDARPQIAFAAVWSATESLTLERAFSSAGPWDTVTTGSAEVASVADDVAQTAGATYYYRARFASRTTGGEPIEITTPAVSYLYGRALERDWATDPHTLTAGVSVLADCQAESSAITARAFDGYVDNDVFVVTTDNPLLGVDLGKACYLTCALVRSRRANYGIQTPISLWGANETPTNTPSKQAVDDPHYTELYRNSEPGAGTASYYGYWYRFPVANPTTAYRYAFIHKNATDAASKNWGNALEVTFYGYDADDAAAAQVIAPEVFTGVRDAEGIHLAWTHGFNVGTLTLERKVGDGAWTTLATPAASAVSWTDAAADLQNGTLYAYRLKAVQGEEERYSTLVSVYWYVPGSGTGLLATYSAPSPLTSCDPAEVRLGSETVTGIHVTKAAGEAVYGTTSDNVLVAWKGRLIVPAAGEYAFTVEASDGFLLEMDGDVRIDPSKLQEGGQDTSACSVLNDWKGTSGAVTTRMRTGYALTAGEHQIRAWWNPTTGAKSCVLKWTLPGATESEIIPATQLVPATEPDSETYGKDGWRFRTVSNTRGYIAQMSDDAFAIAEADVNPVSTYQHGSFAWKKIESETFTLEANVFAPQMFNEYGYIFVSANLNGGAAGDGATLMLYRYARCDRINVCTRAAGATGTSPLLESDLLVSAPGATPAQQATNNAWQWLRIVRDGDRFILRARHGNEANPDGTNGDWVDVATYTDTEKRFGKEVYVGFGSTTANLPDRIYQARYLFSHVRVKVKKGLFVLVR